MPKNKSSRHRDNSAPRADASAEQQPESMTQIKGASDLLLDALRWLYAQHETDSWAWTRVEELLLDYDPVFRAENAEYIQMHDLHRPQRLPLVFWPAIDRATPPRPEVDWFGILAEVAPHVRFDALDKAAMKRGFVITMRPVPPLSGEPLSNHG